jgi:hypothetical protein
MKKVVFLGFIVLVLTIAIAGCRSRDVMSTKHSSGGEWGAANSIDGYAKAHGISRAEAAKRMRDELVSPASSVPSQGAPEAVARMPSVEIK